MSVKKMILVPVEKYALLQKDIPSNSLVEEEENISKPISADLVKDSSHTVNNTGEEEEESILKESIQPKPLQKAARRKPRIEIGYVKTKNIPSKLTPKRKKSTAQQKGWITI
jgi:hypothetical protein